MGEKQIKDLLEKYDYIIKVQQIEGGILAQFPTRVFNPPFEAMIRQYKPLYGTLSGISFMCPNYKPSHNFFPLPEYAIRLAIAGDIINLCELYEYDTDYIKFISKTGKTIRKKDEFLIDLVDKSPTDTQLKLEQSLSELFAQACISNFKEDLSKEAEKLKVKEGYDFLVKIFVERT
jgi:hypothetical protein